MLVVEAFEQLTTTQHYKFLLNYNLTDPNTGPKNSTQPYPSDKIILPPNAG